MEVQAGKIITLDKKKALRLLNEGKIIPTEKVAYRIYSEILQAFLQAFLWVVDTDEDMKTLRDKSITEPIYTADGEGDASRCYQVSPTHQPLRIYRRTGQTFQH